MNAKAEILLREIFKYEGNYAKCIELIQKFEQEAYERGIRTDKQNNRQYEQIDTKYPIKRMDERETRGGKGDSL